MSEKPLTYEELLAKAESQEAQEEASLSTRALAARQLYKLSEKDLIGKSVSEDQVEQMLANIEMNDMEYLATLQAQIKDLYGKELKPVNVPKIYDVVIKAWPTILKAGKDPKINKTELSKKKEFFLSVYQLIVSHANYRSQIKDMAKFDNMH